MAQTLNAWSPNTDKVVLHACPKVALPVPTRYCKLNHLYGIKLLSLEPVLHTHFPPRKNEYILVFPPERSVYIHLSPWFLGGKSEYILKFPPHTQFSPFALIDYARAITPIRGRPYGDFCRAFDAEEGRSPLFFSICNTFWNISQWLQFDPYVLLLAMAGFANGYVLIYF